MVKKVNKRIIKVLNPDVANNLAALGFNYIKENINQKECFCFPISGDLLKVLASNYTKTDYFVEQKIRF